MVGVHETVAAEKMPGFTFKPSGFGSDFTTTAGLASLIFLAVKPVILEVCVKGWIEFYDEKRKIQVHIFSNTKGTSNKNVQNLVPFHAFS